MINEGKVLRTLVNEYISSTTGSELLLLNKFVRMIGGHFFTVICLDDNELIMTKCLPVTDKFRFNSDMKVNNNNGVTMKLQR